MLWFTSDLHFGHGPVLGFCDRPFKDLKHMEDQLIYRINSRVKPTDTLVIVGDVFFTNATDRHRILKRLNGIKILVQGNHDKGKGQISGYDLVVQEMEMKIAGQRVTVSHYPFKPNRFQLRMPWWKAMVCDIENLIRFYHRRPKDEGQYLLHGHTHSRKKFEGKVMHVGCDAWDWYPISLKQITSHIAKTEGN